MISKNEQKESIVIWRTNKNVHAFFLLRLGIWLSFWFHHVFYPSFILFFASPFCSFIFTEHFWQFVAKVFETVNKRAHTIECGWFRIKMLIEATRDNKQGKLNQYPRRCLTPPTKKLWLWHTAIRNAMTHVTSNPIQTENWRSKLRPIIVTTPSVRGVFADTFSVISFALFLAPVVSLSAPIFASFPIEERAFLSVRLTFNGRRIAEKMH